VRDLSNASQPGDRPGRSASTEIVPGLHVIPGRNGSCNSYLIRDKRRTVLVDTGLPQTQADLTAALLQLDVPVEAIDLVVLTHEHYDHSGAAEALQAHALVAAHPLAATKIALADDFALMSGLFGQSSRGFVADVRLEQGSVIDTGDFHFSVVHTPGHCSGHISLFEPDRGILIGGDAVFKGGLHGGILGSGNISDYVASLRKLRGLRLSLILPGHGEVSTEPYVDLDGALERLEGLHSDTRQVFGMLRTEQQFQQILASLKGINK
jgi:hydroxyacylglutathione hydrolase